MERIKTAERLFADGCNCAQSLLTAFGTGWGVSVEQARKLGAPFGGGVSRTGGTCGAALGALLALGLREGHTDCEDDAAIAATRERAQEFLRRFIAVAGGRTCPEVLGADLALPGELERAVAEGLFEKACAGAVRAAAEILVEMTAAAGENQR